MRWEDYKTQRAMPTRGTVCALVPVLETPSQDGLGPFPDLSGETYQVLICSVDTLPSQAQSLG